MSDLNNSEKKSDLLDANYYFPSVVYTIDKPEFLDNLKKISEIHLNEIKKTSTKDEIYPVFMTNNLYDIPEILPFQYYVGQTAHNLLTEQGYDLLNQETYFSELWCQEHYKHSGMEQHVHGYGSQMVGFYFLDCPEKCSRVVFHDPRAGKNQINFSQKDVNQITLASTEINFIPKPGMLMMTNSFLPHSFSRHGSDEPIRFIHFNIGLRFFNNSCVSSTAEIV